MAEATGSTVDALLANASPTYAQEAGITVKDKPAALFQLLEMPLLLSARISSDIAVAATKEILAAGLRTPERARKASRKSVIDALGRGHYVRYDESTATRLHEAAELVQQKYQGDLRKLAERSDSNVEQATELLTEFKGIGGVGAAIFLREVQDTWTWVRPYFDERALEVARELRLPDDPKKLAKLAPGGACAPLAAALVRVSLDKALGY
ncbi:endonuclease [Skermania sp. ID1734]|uniref:endonuclease n=1 Tax=Skermania sp. ID1734 TaxID=2597516 RepID=UPI001C8F3449|nr:endonuclease [Skermania sp. ID1734]